MQIVPFYPLMPDILAEIVRLKLDKVGRRLATSQKLKFEYSDAVVQAIAARCTEVETGARNIDHIVNKTLLPDIATEVLARLGSEREYRALKVDVSVFPIRLPPLRERPSDIPLLIDHFLARACKAHARATPALTADALDALCCWRYPGNVRELRNVIERALLLLDEGQRIDLCHLPTDVSAQRQVLVSAAPAGDNGAAIDLKNVVQQYEARMIEAKLREAGWNQSRAAKMLNISRRSLVDKLNRYAIRGPNLAKGGAQNIVGQLPSGVKLPSCRTMTPAALSPIFSPDGGLSRAWSASCARWSQPTNLRRMPCRRRCRMRSIPGNCPTISRS
jgi:C-terminal, D2-small domain, of ClpB protein/Bacterial regulatory protein, Fis family